MLYKTMVLGLLKQRPQLHNQLRKHRMLLAAVDFYGKGLKASHEAHKILLAQANPDTDPNRIASEALEIALNELEHSLPNESPPDDSEALSLAEAMAFLRRHTPPE